MLVAAGATTYAQDLVAPLSQVLSDGSANYLYSHERLVADGTTPTWYVGDALVPACAGMCAADVT